MSPDELLTRFSTFERGVASKTSYVSTVQYTCVFYDSIKGLDLHKICHDFIKEGEFAKRQMKCHLKKHVKELAKTKMKGKNIYVLNLLLAELVALA